MSKNAKPALKNWTKGPDGKFVDWSKPPYRHGNRLRLTLDGEDREKIEPETRRQRVMEYYALIRRQAMDEQQKRIKP